MRFIISSRRINYLKTILDREDNELIKRIYNEQKDNPTKGDWIELVKEDYTMIEEEINEEDIKSKGKNEGH